MPHPMCFTIQEIETALRNGPPYPVDPSQHLIHPSAGYVDSGSIKTTREPQALPNAMVLMTFPEACARHATLGAVLRGYRDRTWLLKLQEADLVTGGYLQKVEEAAEEMVRERHPDIIFLCGTCIDQLLGTNYESLALKLERRLGVRFGATYMEPIMKDNRTPFKARDLRALHSVIRIDPTQPKMPWVNIVGRALPHETESELLELLQKAGIERVLHFSSAKSLEELDDMGRACLNIGIEQRAKLACEMMESRYQIPYVLLESSLLPEVIHENYQKLSRKLGQIMDDSAAAGKLQQELSDLRPRLQGLKIAIGEQAGRRSFEAAREMAELGFPIDCVFTLSLQEEDLVSVEMLRKLCPQCRVYFTGTPEILSYFEAPETFDLTIGLDSHYYTKTPTTASVAMKIRYGDYYSILSFLRQVSSALDSVQAKGDLRALLDKNSEQRQEYLRNKLREQAEKRAKEIAPNARLKRWGVWHREEEK